MIQWNYLEHNLALKSNKLHVSQWESVITDALHSVCSLSCTSTNSTPHERLFNHQCHLTSGIAVPTWLSTPGTVLLRQHNRQSKYNPLVEYKLLDANPEHAHVKFANGRESTVSLRDLAPQSKTSDHSVSITPNQLPNYNRNVEMNCETVAPEVNNEHCEIHTEPIQIPTEESTNTVECVNKTINQFYEYEELQNN